jgi:hypothetical protein
LFHLTLSWFYNIRFLSKSFGHFWKYPDAKAFCAFESFGSARKVLAPYKRLKKVFVLFPNILGTLEKSRCSKKFGQFEIFKNNVAQ